MRNDAFICYSKSDEKAAILLANSLRKRRIPRDIASARVKFQTEFEKEAPLQIFLSDGETDFATLRHDLDRSSALVIVCSPQSARDPGIDRIIREFSLLGRADRIFAFILADPAGRKRPPGAPSWLDQVLPARLKYRVLPDGELDQSTTLDPLAADASPHTDGWDAAVLKILAGILGVGFDDLYRREERRRVKRVRLAMAGSLVLAAILGVMAVRAFLAEQQSRIEASNAREISRYIESIFANVDRPAVQKMNPQLMELILDASERDLDKMAPEADLEAQMRLVLGEAYLACGLWKKAEPNLRRSLALAVPGAAEGPPTDLFSTQRDLAEALIGEGKAAEARTLLAAAPPEAKPTIRYQMARALALAGDAAGAAALLREEIAARPSAALEAQADSAFATLHHPASK